MKKLLVMLFLCLIFTVSHHIGYTQTEANYLLVTVQDGLEIRSVEVDKASTEVAALIPNFTIAERFPADWNIARKRSISFSPDQTRMAFLATKTDESHALFIYDLRVNQLAQYDPRAIAIYNTLTWSPDSRYLILSKLRFNQEVELFDTQTGQFSWIIQNGNLEQNFTWLSDSQQFVYSGPMQCSSCTNERDDIYLAHVDGRTPIVLTDLGNWSLQSDEPILEPTLLTWVESEQRLYFVLNELGREPEEFALLMSVDLNGNVRSEFDFNSLYSGSGYYHNVESMFIGPSGTPIIITQVGVLFDSNGSWLILEYQGNGIVNEIYENKFPISATSFDIQTINDVAISPQFDYVAISGSPVYHTPEETGAERGTTKIIDINTGQPIFEVFDQLGPCRLSWYDDVTLAYTFSAESNCHSGNINEPDTADGIITYNIDTQVMQVIPVSPDNTFMVP